ncbi:MAG TPA: ATP-binding protein [Steroidobacteraceae bacterium]|jgi:signal transduction histidine kinase|nr:ATP-binding protein [Steroidobacteraceae bacterium]
MDHDDFTAPELQQLRDEHALFGELLRVDRVALGNFMAYAARTLGRARIQMRRRTHEPEQFQDKLNRLHKLYGRLWRRATALALPTLARLLESTVAALDAPRRSEARTGDALLPALVNVDAVFLALTTIAQRTGMPLRARRGSRGRSRWSTVRMSAARDANANNQTTQLAVALQQLGEQLAGVQGKLIQLTTLGLEQVPEIQVAAFYDMLSQMLRNAIEHGIEAPAQRRASGKNTRGTLLVEFQLRHGAQSELNFQDDGAGLDAERIVQVAVASGLIAEDSSLEQNRRQASALIFHSGLSTAAQPAGRGLGMRILRDNVKRLHGQIQVATKRGQFTRLRIRLPLSAASSVPAAAAVA